MKGLIDFEENNYYHVVNHAVGTENLFRNDENFRYFLEKYAHHIPSAFDTFAYCLMPNHFHLLVRVHSIEVLKEDPKFKGDVHKHVMQKISNLLNGYAKAYNIRFERKGALFIDYTKRFLIDSDSYFTAAINYIHQNPVAHGFVRNWADWRYSSYHSLISEKITQLRRSEVLEWFGDKEKFVAFHRLNQAPLSSEFEF